MYWPITPILDDDDFGTIGETNDCHEKPKYSETTCSVPLCPPQIAHDLTLARTRAAAIGSRRLMCLRYCRLRGLSGHTVCLRTDGMRPCSGQRPHPIMKSSKNYRDEAVTVAAVWAVGLSVSDEQPLAASDRSVSCCVNCLCHVRFEVFTAVTMKNGFFWVVTPCGSCKNLRFGGTWRLLHQGDKNR
jgi:hypothetical protein